MKPRKVLLSLTSRGELLYSNPGRQEAYIDDVLGIYVMCRPGDIDYVIYTLVILAWLLK